jgi:Spy/CpxP family protein refolding chaperone
MKNRWLIITLLGVAFLPAMGRAGEGMLGRHSMRAAMGGEGGPGMGMMFPLILRTLGLNEDQKTRVHAIMEAHRPKFRDLFSQLRSANDGVSAKLFSPGTVTADDLKAPMTQVAHLREQLMQEAVAVSLEVRGVLTPAQIAKAADVRQRMEGLHAEMKKLLGESGMEPLEAFP